VNTNSWLQSMQTKFLSVYIPFTPSAGSPRGPMLVSRALDGNG
jgi:hypothetical protein